MAQDNPNPTGRGHTLSDLNELVDRYVAVWNEPDADARRSAVAALWAEGGAHYTLSISAPGRDAIEDRIAKAYAQFVGTGDYLFTSGKNAVGQHNTAKFNWEMVPAGGGDSVAVGFDFFVLDGDGRILLDYQYNEPPAPSAELNALAERYVALWNEPDAGARGRAIAALWAPDGVHVTAAGESSGYAAIEATVARAHDNFVGEGFTFRSVQDADGHHGTVRFHWEMVPAGGGDVAAVGFDFLILDGSGRIRADHQFIEVQPGG
jgi:hypothetical protein